MVADVVVVGTGTMSQSESERVEGLLRVSEGVQWQLAAMLVQLRWLDPGVIELPEDTFSLPLAQVKALEGGLRTRFPDDVLAVFAVDGNHARNLWRMHLSAIQKHCEDAWEKGLPKSYVAIGERDGQYACIDRDPPTRLDPWIRLYTGGTEVARGRRLAPWLEMIAEEMLDDVEMPDIGFDLQLTVRLVSEVTNERMVTHPKFGVGRVVRTEGEGEQQKLTIDFEDVGTKSILARFVSDA